MMTDPIADMLTRIRNAQLAHRAQVRIPYSKLKFAVAEILRAEGYVGAVERVEQKPQDTLRIELKYRGKTPGITFLKRESTPGHRVYRGAEELPRVLDGFGLAVVSTSQGVMTGKQARKLGIGGEILCTLY